MAKSRQKHPEQPVASRKIGGPFLAAAIFCENILEDMRHMLSVQGISDSAHLMVPPFVPKDVPSEENPVSINQQILLIFRSGDSPGKHQFKLEIESPSGKRTVAKEDEVTLSDGPSGGLNFKIAVTMSLTNPTGGLYLADVFLDGKLMTRMPFTANVVRHETPDDGPPKKADAKKKAGSGLRAAGSD